MSRKLFGTDGIRGVAGEYPLDPKAANAFGCALGKWVSHLSGLPEVVIGMDTRESGQWLAEQVAGGMARAGVRARFAGVTTTPGVAYLTRTDAFVAGVMISASHNPYQDNGLKAFAHNGYKLPDDQELELEGEILTELENGVEPRGLPLTPDESLDAHYVNYLAGLFRGSLAGLPMVVDCANGAASGLAPTLFRKLGASVTTLACEPDGRNINLHCGALHVEALRERVISEGAAMGVAFDGDADRAILIARSGRVVDGDHVLLIAARALHGAGRLPGGQVIATVMSNLGLEVALRKEGVSMARTPVGDRYVLEEMLRTGSSLGGEQSGHVIFLDHSTTGDGMLTAIQVLQIMADTGAGLDELCAGFEVYPQTLVNIRVKERRPLEELPEVGAEIRRAEQEFGSAGRVLVRFSGTEPLARVMVEGPDIGRVQAAADRIAGAIRAALS
jgi:phosphoglucosamine mutase